MEYLRRCYLYRYLSFVAAGCAEERGCRTGYFGPVGRERDVA